MFSRSCTLSTAFEAVGEQTPAEHVMLAVGAAEITTPAAEGAVVAQSAAKDRHANGEDRIADALGLQRGILSPVC
jgi:hypothetical protein